MGNRVILVDADPQSNLTGLRSRLPRWSELEEFYAKESTETSNPDYQLPLNPPVPIESVDCVQVESQENLFLLPGHIALSEYEVTLGIAQELSGSIQTLQNLPGSISRLLMETATATEAQTC